MSSSKRGRLLHIEIALGSKSEYKLNATRLGCERATFRPTIETFDIDSGEDAQPIGIMAMKAGATTRAIGAQKQNGCRNKYCLGLENGIVRCDGISFDSTMVALIRPDRRIFYAQSAAIVMPEECVLEAERLGFKTHTAGSVFARMYGGSANDPHEAITYFKTNRTNLMAHAVQIVLAQAHL